MWPNRGVEYGWFVVLKRFTVIMVYFYNELNLSEFSKLELLLSVDINHK